MSSLADSKQIEADEVILQQEVKASLDEKILKLCAGLRAKGLVAHAESLENKFVTYKAAANTHLYRAHDEDGEDLVNAAHPDGDVNMGDGEHGDVETILSKHKKIVDIVQKTPNGKLASVVAQCKIVLGQVGSDESAETDDEKKSKAIVGQAKKAFDALCAEIVKNVGQDADQFKSLNSQFNAMTEKFNRIPSAAAIDKLSAILMQADAVIADLSRDSNLLIDLFKAYWLDEYPEANQQGSINISKKYLKKFTTETKRLQGVLASAKNQLNGIAQEVPSENNPFTTKAQDFLNTLGQWKTAIDSDQENTPQDKQQADAWINAKAAAISDLLEQIKGAKLTPEVAEQQLTNIVKDFSQFKTTWVG